MRIAFLLQGKFEMVLAGVQNGDKWLIWREKKKMDSVSLEVSAILRIAASLHITGCFLRRRFSNTMIDGPAPG